MTYYPDLARCDYFGACDALVAVGWLAKEYAHGRGSIAREDFVALAVLAANPWQPVTLAGSHRCELCVFTGGPGTINVDGNSVAIGCDNIFIPSTSVVYVAPSMILHYIDAHDYRPPDEYLVAVTSCPPMRSMDYLRQLQRHGVHKLASPATGRGLTP